MTVRRHRANADHPSSPVLISMPALANNSASGGALIGCTLGYTIGAGWL